jgi:leucyl aminopeptidase (aminopeptidase T)
MKPEDIACASAIMSECLRVRSKEKVLLITDKGNLEFSECIAYLAKELGADISVFYVPETIRPVESINDIYSIALVVADVVIYILDAYSSKIDISREVAFRYYLKSLPLKYKGRVCMMPGFTEEMKSAILIDYSKLKAKADYLKNTIIDKDIRVKTLNGTDIRFSLLGRVIKIDDGDISNRGFFGNIPAGEIFTAPIEDTVNGKIVIDGSIGGLGAVEHPFSLEIESGIIRKIVSNNEENDIFKQFKIICEYDSPATKTLGEFGIGLNQGANLIGNMLMDEKVEGTVHFAFGDSYGLGKTTSKFHTDCLIKNPTIFVNDKCIMEEGKFNI